MKETTLLGGLGATARLIEIVTPYFIFLVLSLFPCLWE